MKLRPLFILLAALTLSATVRSAPGTLIPRPQEATRLDGQFVFTTGIPVVYASGLEPLAEYIADYIPLQRLDDRTWTAGAALRLSLDGTMDDESYRLTVTPQGVQVVGADYGGVFNGLQTLLQLLPSEVYTGQATLPLAVDACRIEDAPRFHYRGMMLDVVRTWMDADRVKRHIDLLSHLKINKLHLLLSNDEGWRLEIKSHPELTEIGAWRGGDSPVMPVYGKWDEKYGGFYTQDEMRDLIRYAAVASRQALTLSQPWTRVLRASSPPSIASFHTAGRLPLASRMRVSLPRKYCSSACPSAIPSRAMSARQFGHSSHWLMSTSSPPIWRYSDGKSAASSPRISASSR